MKVLFVSATEFELAPLKDRLKAFNTEHDINFLTTGVGAVPTCFHLSNYLHKNKIDLVINAGIAGAFDIEKHPVGSVFEIVQDRFGDLGAEFADGHFEDVFELGLEKPDVFYKNGWLSNPTVSNQLQKVNALTINKVTGQLEKAKQLQHKYNADLESMEGAAVAFTCLQLDIPFHQIRSVSNRIEDRDKEKWDIPLAIKALNETLFRFFQNL